MPTILIAYERLVPEGWRHIRDFMQADTALLMLERAEKRDPKFEYCMGGPRLPGYTCAIYRRPRGGKTVPRMPLPTPSIPSLVLAA